ncbi:MAG: ClpXP protease specificity-enhancing factor SspB, partial [Rhizomicrobium sp.]
FSGLKIKEHHFEVTLTFRKLPATLVIPFEALTAFFDPGVQFGLQFRGTEGDPKLGATSKLPPAPAPEQNREQDSAPKDKASEKPAAPGEVVSLDSFRKK